MTDEGTWIEAYTLGKKLEKSRDKFNWFPVDTEPYAGDGWFYRVKDTKYETYNISDKHP